METTTLESTRQEAAPAGARRGHPAGRARQAAAPTSSRRPLPSPRPQWGAAEARLEAGFTPVTSTLTSFLVNAFYLVGDHDILEWTPRDGRVADDLARLGHRHTAAFPATLRAAKPRPRHDRAMALARAFGHLSDEENEAWLRSMHRMLRPGGLLCFHVIDRDRAWNRVGSRDGGEIAFEPASGRLSARLRDAEGAAWASVRAYNLAEVRSLLQRSGFELERAYGDWEGGNVAEAGSLTGRIIVVAAKPRARRKVTRKVLPEEGEEGEGT